MWSVLPGLPPPPPHDPRKIPSCNTHYCHPYNTCLTVNTYLFILFCFSYPAYMERTYSICIGNVFMILVLRDKTELNESTRKLVFTVLTVVCGFGTIILMVLRPSVDADGKENEANLQKAISVIPKQELRDSMRLLMTKDMLLLSTLFLFTGR